MIAAGLGFTPILLRNPFTYPLTAFMEHQFWIPLARLSYGAYLSAGIFMLFRTYNMERGLWACELDCFFLFMAYLSFAYLFSFMITVIVELPCHNLYQTFILGDTEVYNRTGASAQKQAPAIVPKFATAKRVRQFSGDEDSESDAETLDRYVADEINSFVSASPQ